MKLFREHVIVKVPNIFVDETKYMGLNGTKLFVDVTFNPQDHIRTYGIVTSVPDELLDEPIASNHLGGPAYYSDDYKPHDVIFARDIQQDVRVGDKAHFHYNCLVPNTESNNYNHFFLETKKEMENGKEVTYHYFRVKYSLVFAVVRYHKMVRSMTDFEWWMEPELVKGTIPSDPNADGGPKNLEVFTRGDDAYTQEILPIGGYVLVEPDKETWDDISIPIPETLNGKKLLDKNGQIVMKPKDQWLVKKSVPGTWYLSGWIRHVGSPLKPDRCSLAPGDYVYFQRHTDTSVTIEGKEYWRMRQRHIVSKDTLKSIQYAEVQGT